MNCADYETWMQQRLDGAAGPPDEGDRHRASCPACASLHQALGRLEEGLRRRPRPTPPERLAESIVFQVRAEQRAAGRRRVLVYAAALAACLLLGLYLGGRRGDLAATPTPTEPIPVVEAPWEPQRPKVNDQVGEAGTALAALVSRTADEAVGEGRLLLPNPMPPMTSDMTATLPQALEQPAQSLNDAALGVSAGLEPVASSARRAVNLFFRDMPPVTQGLQ
jgi:hypothetical protein